ncbi:MAG: restriction endonuclease subunit S [Clostridium sp.]|nr:restriction endonuclease subunit S [Clostridium sp.]MCM1443725.1 restriction endonuclease subunit S [Candidatus Amulumruptor caecigallinarius]
MKYDMVKLKELCVVNQGLQIPISKRFKEPGENRHFYITVQFLKDSAENYYIGNPPKNVTCTENEILVVRTGNTGQVITGVAGCFHNNFFKVTPNERVYSKYLYYSLNNKRMYDTMLNAASGTTIPDLKHSSFYDLKISLPKIDIQIKIAKILDNICNKIKLNNQMNNNLYEVINKCFSKYLDELDDYEELDIKEIFDFETGVEPGSKNYLETKEEDTIRFYRVGDMDGSCKTFIKKDLANNKFVNENDIVVSFDATIGRIGYALSGSYSTGMKKISVKDKYKHIVDNSFVYAYFSNKDTQNVIRENARGTTILHASSSIDFMKFKYNEQFLERYSKLISTSFERMKNNKIENQNLEKLRDTLLPKLMNGEIDLENIEI